MSTNLKDQLNQPVFNADSIRFHHQALVDISSKAGGLDAGIRLNEAGQKAAEYLLQGYRDAGLENVRFEEFYPSRWWPEEYELTVLGKNGLPDWKLNTFPLWYTQGAQQLELEVVYGGYGTRGELRGVDMKGKAILIDMKRLLHFIQSYTITKALETIRKKGIKAVIIADTRIDGPTGNRAGDGSVLKNQRGQEADLYPVPVFSIGKSEGIRLKELLKQGTTRVRVNLNYSLDPGRAVNVIGELPGNGKIDETIIIGGHYDTWFTGAVDNLGSQASLIEMARHFAHIPSSQRDRNLMFVSLFGHEFGNECMGHGAFVEKHSELKGKVTCFIDIDGSGSWGWEEHPETGEVFPTNDDDKGGTLATSWRLAALTHQSIYKYSKGPWVNFPNNFFVADIRGPIEEAGFPSLLVISKHVFYHSIFDTIEKITPDQVYRRTLINCGIIEDLLATPEGLLIKSDGNPHGLEANKKSSVKDISPQEFPSNPHLWQSGPPSDLSILLLPDKARIFSPVIAWVGYWKSDAIMKPHNVRWKFGGLLGLLGSRKGFFSGTMYFLPGNKTISLTMTDNKGRSTTVSRKIYITGDRRALLGGAFLVLVSISLFFI